MRKIANADELENELRHILGYVRQTQSPSRARVASELRGLADRIAVGDGFETPGPERKQSLAGAFATIKDNALMAYKNANSGHYRTAASYLAWVAHELDRVLTAANHPSTLGYKLSGLLRKLQAKDFATLNPDFDYQ